MRLNTPSRKKSLILLGVFALAAAGALVLPSLLFDANRVRDAVVGEIGRAIGKPLAVKGAVEFHLLPSPTLTLHNVEIEPGTDPAKPTPHMRAESLVIGLPFSGLFSEKPTPGSITLSQPVLEVERGSDGDIHWDWLQAEGGMLALPAAVEIRGGKAIYFNPYNEKTVRLEEINLTVSQHAQSGARASGSMRYLGRQMHLEATLPPPQNGQESTRMELKFWQSAETILSASLERIPPQGAAGALWRGSVTLQVEDLHQWVPRNDPKNTLAPTLTAAGQPVQQVEEAKPEPYPLKLSGTLEYGNERLKIGELALETADSAGKGEASLLLAEVPNINVRLLFDRLKIQPAVFNTYLGGARAAQEAKLSPVAAAESEPRLPKNLVLDLELGADTLFVDAHQFSGVTMTGGLRDGEFTIASMKGSFAGGTAISLEGKIVDQAKGMRFQGRTQTSGKDLRAALATFDRAAEKLPEKGFSEYYIKANVFISSEQLRLSEAELKLGDLQLGGGMVTYFEALPRVEAEIVLKDINLDYFRDAWREEIQQSGEHSFIFKVNSNVDFSWLRSLKSIIDLKLNFERFTFLEKTGSTASFRLYARQNEFGLHSIQMDYPDGAVKGEIKINVDNPLPALTADLELPEFNTSYFSEDGKAFGTPWVNPAGTEGRWSAALFDFSWMIGVTGRASITSPRIIHQGENYDRFLLQCGLSNEQLQIGKLSFERFGGKLDFTGALSGGKVPGMSGSFTIFNADLRQILQSFSSMDKLTGRVSVSGSVTTSGITFQEWVKQADAKVVVAGRGVRTEGFNLQGVVDAVLASRSVADVVSNVGKALPSGSTDFSVDGNLNIGGGVLRTPGITVQVGQALGNVTGEVLLIPWKMAVNALFQMRMLQSETIPTLAVDLNGTPDHYEMRTDTSSLEAYVAKKIVGK